MNRTPVQNDLMLHIRFDGRSADIALSSLLLTPSSSDEQVRTALANYLEVKPGRLAGYVIERHGNGNVTLRPEAVFG